MESGGNFEDYIRFLSCHLFGPVNHGQNWKGWERRVEKGLIISDNQDETCLIIMINDTSIGDLPLIITISDTCKNQPKRLDFDNTINLSSLIVSLDIDTIPRHLCGPHLHTQIHVYPVVATNLNK